MERKATTDLFRRQYEIKLSASSGNYSYCQPLSTIPECQGRMSPSLSTAYPSSPKVSDSNVRGFKINEISKRPSESVFMAKFHASSHNHASVSGISDVLQSSQITNDRQSSDNSKMIRSHLQIKSVSRKKRKIINIRWRRACRFLTYSSSLTHICELHK